MIEKQKEKQKQRQKDKEKEKEKGKKTLSSRQIFRAIALQYKQPDIISIKLLSDLCSGIFYPRGLDNEGRIRYRDTFIQILSSFASTYSDSLTQDEFCNAMMDFQKCSKEEVQDSFCQKMFNRYQNEHKVIDQKGFTLLAKALEIKDEEIKETFMHVCDRSNVITYQKLRQFLR